MRELMEWASTSAYPDRPWLVLGKGPTFDRRADFDLSQYNLVSLNHVVRELHVDVAHMVDIDVAVACGKSLAGNCGTLLMPRYPHKDFRPGTRRLESYLDEIPALRELDEQGRLVWYNSSLASPVGRSPVIGLKYFSSEPVFQILARLGARTVRSLGVDGGRSYSRSFADLEDETLLANGRLSFERQFEQIDQIVKEQGIDYRPLVEPIRVFVGVDESQSVAAHVLEHTIRKHTSRPVEVTPLRFPTPMPKDPANWPRTTFSFCRFLIPQLCEYQGRAIYLDADMQVFGDLAEVWDLPMDGRAVLCTNQPEPLAAFADHPDFRPGRQMSVMLLDCARLPWDVNEIVAGLDERTYTYKQLMTELCVVAPELIGDDLPPEWNHLERYEPDLTKLVHYTVVPTQPWKNDDNPLAEVWMSAYREAVVAGAVPPEEVEFLVREGVVKSSLTAGLGKAPARRAVFSNAAREQALVQEMLQTEVISLRAELDRIKRSRAYRLSSLAAEPARVGRGLLRRIRGARGARGAGGANFGSFAKPRRPRIEAGGPDGS